MIWVEFAAVWCVVATVLGIMELCWGDVGLALTIPRHGLGNAALSAVGTDEQKAQFEAIGPGRTAASPSSSALASSDESASSRRHYHRRHHAGIGGIVRRLISFGW